MLIKHVITKDGVYFRLHDDTKNVPAPQGCICSALTYKTNFVADWIRNPFENKDKQFVCFCNFGTVISFRHKGYGRKLLQDVKEYYKGCILYLGVSSMGEMTDQELIDFYISEGFKIIENYKNHSSYPHMAIEL